MFFLFYEVSSIRVAAQESVDVLTLTDSAEPISESDMKHRSTTHNFRMDFRRCHVVAGGWHRSCHWRIVDLNCFMLCMSSGASDGD